jgi:hypothetical protein
VPSVRMIALITQEAPLTLRNAPSIPYPVVMGPFVGSQGAYRAGWRRRVAGMATRTRLRNL